MDLAFAVRKNARTPVNSGMDGKLVIEINVRKKSGFDLVLRYEARTHTLAFLQMIRAIIFDLDNCLSAADEVGQELMAPVFDAIRKSNKGTLSEAQLNRAFEDCWRIPLNVVAREHGFSSEMVDAGWAPDVADPLLCEKDRIDHDGQRDRDLQRDEDGARAIAQQRGEDGSDFHVTAP